MAQQIDSTLKELRTKKISDSFFLMIIFKALEIGTLTSETALSTLQTHGFALRPEYAHSQKDLPEPMNIDVENSFSNDTETTFLSETTHSSACSPNEDIDPRLLQSPIIDNSFKYPIFISHPTTSWEAAAKNTNKDANFDELLRRYKSLLHFTEKSNQVKSIPIGITSFKRAFEHLTTVFIPRLVCCLLL